MERMEEYRALLEQLDQTPLPAALDDSVERAGQRARRRGLRRDWGAALASLGGVAAAFALMVNLSVPFAMACKRVPILKDLAAAVALSPSLKAAVENDYIQYVGQERTANGVTMKLDYLILDQTQINFFYTVSGGDYAEFFIYPSLSGVGEELQGYSLVSGAALPGELSDFNANFTDGFLVPEKLRLTCKVEGRRDHTVGEAPADALTGAPHPYEEPEIIAVFDFDLTLDPRLTGPGETISLDQWLTVDGQRLHLEALEVNPTHARLRVSSDRSNTAWCRGLELCLADGRGSRYEMGSRAGTNGTLVSTGGDEENGEISYYLESPYFSGKGPYTLHITAAHWLDKGKEWAGVDLEKGTARGLPEGIELASVKREGADVRLTFSVPDDGQSHFSWDYRDPEGAEHRLTSSSYYSQTQEDGSTVHRDEFVLPDYPFSAVELKLSYSRTTQFSPSLDAVVK